MDTLANIFAILSVLFGVAAVAIGVYQDMVEVIREAEEEEEKEKEEDN